MRWFQRKPFHKHTWGKEDVNYDTMQVFYRCECGACKWTDVHHESGGYSYPMAINERVQWYECSE